MATPAPAVNCTYCEKLWSPFVTLKPRPDAVKAKSPAVVLTVRAL